MKICIYCAEEIKDIARKCKYCGSMQSNSAQPTSTEKIADWVIKFIGTLSIVIAILVGVSSYWGFKNLREVQEEAGRVKAEGEKGRKELQDVKDRLAETERMGRSHVVDQIDRVVYSLLDRIDIDSPSESGKKAREELKRHVTELSRLEKGMEKKDKSKVHFLIDGLFAYDADNYDAAINYLRKADQDSYSAHRILSIALTRAAQKLKAEKKMDKAANYFTEAEDHMKKALELIAQEDQRSKLETNLGVIAVARGDFKRARENLVKVTRADPDYSPAYYALAGASANEQKYEETIKWLNVAIDKGMFRGYKAKASKKIFLDDAWFKGFRQKWGSQHPREYEELLRKMEN